MEMTTDEQFEKEVFEYLDNLRESGITNMFGAAPYIEDAFEIGMPMARKLLRKWMDTFNDRHPTEK